MATSPAAIMCAKILSTNGLRFETAKEPLPAHRPFTGELFKRLYIGSFAVKGNDHHERISTIHKELEALRVFNRSKRITVCVTIKGIKICSEDGLTVFMAHALRRISYATCDAAFKQVAFLAREPAGEASLQYCHVFVTETSPQTVRQPQGHRFQFSPSLVFRTRRGETFESEARGGVPQVNPFPRHKRPGSIRSCRSLDSDITDRSRLSPTVSPAISSSVFHVPSGDVCFLRPRRLVNIGVFNIRTLRQVGQQAALASTLSSLELDVCCVSETRVYDSSTVIHLSSPLDSCRSKRFCLRVSGDAEAESHGRAGVGIALSSRAEQCLLDWIPDVRLSLKGRLYDVCVRSILLYGSETWPVRKQDIDRLAVFDHRCLCQLADIKWTDRVSNVAVHRRVFRNVRDARSIGEVVTLHSLRWLGHVLRMPA
ncbi:uncharacterized protein DEA37_0003379 [Paragonimus westermani]|uniref:PID domain-containing protein n=1 Tax=Paragonimus westermani TaxID=34504 RepID=A0A5J4NMY9_9TREM|nr:uncharacterized protein DEA37_0003379 [Paragonimus westermani]